MKFKVNATLSMIMTITKTVEANNLQEATIKVLKDAKIKDWRERVELKTNSK